MKRICIFGGASKGKNIIYTEKAKQFGELIAKKNIELIFGGGNDGIMGVVSNAVLQKGGKVTSVIIKKLLPHLNKQSNETIILEKMSERKDKMVEIADCFFVLPGGLGTSDEFFNVFTLLQLKIIDKPIVLLNFGGYYNKLIDALKFMVEENFLDDKVFNLLIIEDDPKKAIEKCLDSDFSKG
ncbi:MAG: TIGR00730 family Rossman fold protein [Elusimicrobiota bacterium]|nr:TIGR00730 family Rossman fold protein [Elusimicrobiota bacterium]